MRFSAYLANRLRATACLPIRVAVGTVAVCACLHAAADVPRAKIECVAPESITVDGKLSEKIYQGGEWNSGFTIARSSDKARNQTFFRLFTDGEYLYMAARMHKKNAAPYAQTDQRDSMQIGAGDNVSLFIRANGDTSEFLQFQVAPNGALADIRLQQGGVTKEYAWNTDAEAACRVDPQTGEWTMELAVPLASLQIDPDEAVWHVNVGRVIIAQKPEDGIARETSSWIASPTEIDNANCLTAAALPDFDRSVFGWRMHGGAPRVVLKGGKPFLCVDVELTNNTGAARAVELRSRFAGVDNHRASQRVTLAANETRTFETLTPLGSGLSGEGVFSLGVVNEAGLLAVSSEQVAYAYTPARLTLKAPGYRATIFATQQLNTLRAELVQLDSYAEITGIAAKLVTQEGRHLPAHVAQDGEDGKWAVVVEGIGELPDGAHVLQVSFKAKEKGTDAAATTHTLKRQMRKVPHQPGELWIDEKGVVYREGKPFPAYGFHYGRYDYTGKVQAVMPGMFYNTYLPLWAEPPFVRMNLNIDHLAALGIYSVVSVTSANPDGTRRNPSDILTEKERAGFRALAEASRGNPNIVGYYLADEPELIGHTPKRLKAIYDILREHDPYHPVIVTNNTDEGVRNYQYGGDIVNPDPYPIFLKGQGSARHFSRIANHIGSVIGAQESYRALWVTPQAFDLSPFRPGETDYRAPTAFEIRAHQAIALIYGAVGITWYTEEGVWAAPGCASSVPYLSQEYVWLYPHIVAARPQVLKTPREVAAGMCATEKGVVLMVVNLERAKTRVAFDDARLTEIGKWRVLGTDEVLAGGGALAFELEAHETLILASDNLEMPKNLQPWERVLADERRLENAVQTSPDNIALNCNGAVSRAVNYPKWNWNTFYATNGVKDTRDLGFFLPYFKPGMGIEIAFPDVKTPRRAVLTGSNIIEGKIEAQSLEDPEKWVAVARIDNAKMLPEQTVMLSPAVKTRRLRVVGETTGPMAFDGIRIVQVEVYEK